MSAGVGGEPAERAGDAVRPSGHARAEPRRLTPRQRAPDQADRPGQQRGIEVDAGLIGDPRRVLLGRSYRGWEFDQAFGSLQQMRPEEERAHVRAAARAGRRAGRLRHTLPDRAAHDAARARRTGARAPRRDVDRRRRRRSGSRSPTRRPRPTASATRCSRTSAAPATSGLFMRNQIEFMPTFYGVQAAGGVAVPLNADSRGLLLQRVIERADVRAIVVRGDQLDALQELDGLGAVELHRRHRADGPAARVSVHGARVVEYRAWIAGRSERAPARAARQLRGGADPVHVGHDGQLEGRRLPAPLPLPVLGDRSATRRATPATTC